MTKCYIVGVHDNGAFEPPALGEKFCDRRESPWDGRRESLWDDQGASSQGGRSESLWDRADLVIGAPHQLPHHGA